MRPGARRCRSIRYPAHVVEKLAKVRATERRLDEAGAAPSDKEIAAGSGLSIKEVVDLRDNLPAALSLETALDAVGAASGSRIWPSDTWASIPPTSDGRWACSARELLVLSRRFGFLGEPATLDTIGQEFGVTRERIRQIESKAIRKAADALRGIRARSAH